MSTSFRHDQRGTPSALWDGVVRGATVLPWAAILRQGDLLVVAPHPDDETLGAGGLIAGACAAGLDVTVFCCTDGEGAEVDLGPEGGDLAEVRRREMDAALRLLGDGGRTAPHVVRAALHDGSLAERRSDLDRLIRPMVDRAGIVVAPWPDDGHADHEAVGAACRSLCEELGRPLLLYPVWMWHWGAPPVTADLDLLRVPLPPSLVDRKRRAIDAHRSQRRPPRGSPILSDEFIEHFTRDAEVFVGSVGGGVLDPGDRSSAEFFDAMYASVPDGDPWAFATSDAERARVDLVVSQLGDRRYRRCLEPGCSVGELTRRLCGVSDHVLAMDLAPTAIATARRRHGDLTGVEFRVGAFPGDLTEQDVAFDLIVLSEIGYYLEPDELRRAVEDLLTRLEPGGTLVASHWTGESDDHVLSGQRTHEILRDVIPWPPRAVQHEPTVLIERWERP